jgi:hypothetical protein
MQVAQRCNQEAEALKREAGASRRRWLWKGGPDLEASELNRELQGSNKVQVGTRPVTVDTEGMDPVAERRRQEGGRKRGGENGMGALGPKDESKMDEFASLYTTLGPKSHRSRGKALDESSLPTNRSSGYKGKARVGD